MITRSIAHSATRRYLSYSEADFEFFSTLQGRRVAPIGVKFGTQEGTPHFTPIGATVRV